MGFMPENAPLVVLMLLGALGALGLLGLVVVYGLVRRRRRLVAGALVVALAGVAVYGALLVGVALASDPVVLAAGGFKYFCEIDCHEAVSVEGLQIEGGRRYVVTLRVWFDEETVSARRPPGFPLTTAPRALYLTDLEGQRYPSLEEARLPSRELLPGESVTSQMVFEVPRPITQPRLLVVSADWPTMLLIGHENSPWHEPMLLELPEASR